MTVHIYRAVVKGPARMTRLYAMPLAQGVIATAKDDGRCWPTSPAAKQWVASIGH